MGRSGRTSTHGRWSAPPTDTKGSSRPQAARPGDLIQYTATYRNTGKAAVRDLDATLPIPADTEYVASSARPQDAKASVDGRSFAAMPLVRRVVRDGKSVEEPVALREYRYLRWHAAELGAGQALEFTARVKVIDDAGSGK